jgi:3-hydroxyacyl-[acyl-carrier-protein] dehydratase
MTTPACFSLRMGEDADDMDDLYCLTRFCIAEDHPALSGHFPGNPVVPGVVLLDRVAEALLSWRGARIVGLPQVKFMHPLLPGQSADLLLEDGVGSVRFKLLHDGTLIASGQLEILAEELA